ncbi:MAG TPA: ATP-binding protein [Blastocatellia bacterium]|nr:ATP-binding protein [Blastocatellia bacterium]
MANPWIKLRPRSLRIKLTVWFALTFALIIFLSDAVTYQGLSSELESEVDANLVSMASMEAAGLKSRQPNSGVQIPESRAYPQFKPQLVPDFVEVIDHAGKIVSMSGLSAPVGPLLEPGQLSRVLKGQTLEANSVVEGHPVRLAALNVNSNNGALAIITGTRTDDLIRKNHWILLNIALVDLATVAVSVAVGYFIIGRALRPVDNITERAKQIGAGDLHQRVEPVDSSLEMGRLTAVLNEMFDRLQQLFESQRQLIQDASHEIRSPLAAIRCRLEIALRQPRPAAEYRQVIEGCLQDVGRMTELAEDMLLLARADSDNLALEFRELSLSDLLHEVCDELTGLAESRQIDVTVNVQSSCLIYADRLWMHRAFRNITENALKYTPNGGKVTVSAAPEGESIRTDVMDTGVGIPEEERSNIFRRFYRVDPARSRGDGGTGLGLAICDQIIRAHGGHIEVESTLGQGTTFSVFLASAEALLDQAVN